MNRKLLFAVIALALVGYLVSSHTLKGKADQITEGSVLSESTTTTPPPELVQPARIAASPDGDIFVSDYKQNLIFTLGSDLSVRKYFEVDGKPLGVAWGQGKIFVGNETTQSVEVYNRNGKLLYDLGMAVTSPTDIAVDNDRNMVFVSDTQEQVVKVFDTSGTFLSQIPAAGQKVLRNPTGIAVDPARSEVIVSDFGDPLKREPASVKIYDYDGTFRVVMYGSTVQSEYRFSRPQGLALTANGNFMVVDSMLGEVLVFDRNTLQGIRSLGSFGSAEGQLRLPLDVMILPESTDVYVTDNRNGRIDVFRGGGTP